MYEPVLLCGSRWGGVRVIHVCVCVCLCVPVCVFVCLCVLMCVNLHVSPLCYVVDVSVGLNH